MEIHGGSIMGVESRRGVLGMVHLLCRLCGNLAWGKGRGDLDAKWQAKDLQYER